MRLRPGVWPLACPLTRPRAIIIGASWGLGRGLAERLLDEGYSLGLVSRKAELLREMRKGREDRVQIKRVDIRDPEQAMCDVKSLIRQMGGVDLFILNASASHPNEDLKWPLKREIIDTNVTGTCALATVAMSHFLEVGKGHLVGIGSIAALKAHALGPTYSASKAFLSRFLQGLRHRVGRSGLPITVTEIKPGFIATHEERVAATPWATTVDTASRQIYRAIQRKRSHAYVTRRWRLVAWLLMALPDRIYCKRSKRR